MLIKRTVKVKISDDVARTGGHNDFQESRRSRSRVPPKISSSEFMTHFCRKYGPSIVSKPRGIR